MHIKNEYDYRYESDFLTEIFEAIKYVYWREHNVNLPVYGVPFKLKEFHTSKKDISQGIEVNPPEEFKIPDEDIYEETGVKPSMNKPSMQEGSFDEMASLNKELGQ